MNQHTRKQAPGKVAKPYPEFPLFAHASGRWCKKIKGKHVYFGPVDDWQAALARYQEQIDDLHAGRTPRTAPGELTIREMVNRFLTSKSLLRDTGQITSRTWSEYHACCSRLCESMGKERPIVDLTSRDFEKFHCELAKTLGLVALGNHIQRIRSIFKYAYDEGLIAQPVRFGQVFRRPKKRSLLVARQARGLRMFEASDLRKILDATGVQLKAMVLLGINAALGNADVARLEFRHLDLPQNWLNYPRVKTGVERRCWLWEETVAAVREAIASRPQPKEKTDDQLVFITKYGSRWERAEPGNPLAQEMAKLLKALGIHRPGLNFYALRHTFATIGGDSLDQVAVNYIMGHSPASSDMSAVYRERISDERLKGVSKHVREWLFPEATPVAN